MVTVLKDCNDVLYRVCSKSIFDRDERISQLSEIRNEKLANHSGSVFLRLEPDLLVNYSSYPQ